MQNLKSISTLRELFHQNDLKLQELNRTAVRDRKIDVPVVSENELNTRLSGKINWKWGKFFILSQLGYQRMILFGEYFARITISRENNRFDDAVLLMNEYIETVAKPFLLSSIHQSLISQLTGAITGDKAHEIIIKNMKKWQKDYEEWFKYSKNIDENKNQNAKFSEMMLTFNTLYTYSFSEKNFPPLCGEQNY